MTSKQFKCYVMGSDSLLIECTRVLIERGHRVLGIITSGEHVAEWARREDLPVISAQTDYGRAMSSAASDYLFAITHLALIPDYVFSIPRRASINFHDGPLPKYAGLNTPAWGLINQESEWGVSWHVLTSGIDEDDILKQRLFPIADDDTSLTLNAKCFEAGIETFRELLEELEEGQERRTAQDISDRYWFRRHDRPDAACVLDWNRSQAKLSAPIRALDFGHYPNPLGLPKVWRGGQVLGVRAAHGSDATSGGEPGTVIRVDDTAVVVACADGAISLTSLCTLDGSPLSLAEASRILGVAEGDRLGRLDASNVSELTRDGALAAQSEDFWVDRLIKLDAVELPQAVVGSGAGDTGFAHVALPSVMMEIDDDDERRGALIAGVVLLLARLAGKYRFDVAYSDQTAQTSPKDLASLLLAPEVPIRIDIDSTAGFQQLIQQIRSELTLVSRKTHFLRDVVARTPKLHRRKDLVGESLTEVGLQVVDPKGGTLPSMAVLRYVVSPDGRTCGLLYDRQRLTGESVSALQSQLSMLIDAALFDRSRPVSDISLLSEVERRRVLIGWNQTAKDYEHRCVHTLFEEQVRKRPDAIAVSFEDATLTYRELDARANGLAHHLRTLGVDTDTLVGVCVEPSLELVVATLAVMKAGGAYVPLDPAYPKERLDFMMEDSGARVLLTQKNLGARVSAPGAAAVFMDDWNGIAGHASDPPENGVGPSNLIYVIYTSGSTGRPKGVMVEHRNVVNFFRGMDDVIPHDPPGVWLAVTSLSFDISVLELFWTLAHGFEVVVYRDRARQQQLGRPEDKSGRRVDFSIFLWGSDDKESDNKYDLVLDAARFGDSNGFKAIWTPERHFHAFGAAYPNPSVTGAAIAAVTERIQVRAGSCVAPLHHPVRIAEEWAVVDNISHGRVAISFASGWQPDDFLLRPENYKNAKVVMAESIDTVRRLWRGENIAFQNPLGREVGIVTQPRPVQKELPFWVTTAGNPETYRQAGAMGANLLTHLLGQTVEEVAGKIRIYRDARKKAGFDPDTGIVSLMSHSAGQLALPGVNRMLFQLS